MLARPIWLFLNFFASRIPKLFYTISGVLMMMWAEKECTFTCINLVLTRVLEIDYYGYCMLLLHY